MIIHARVTRIGFDALEREEVVINAIDTDDCNHMFLSVTFKQGEKQPYALGQKLTVTIEPTVSPETN